MRLLATTWVLGALLTGRVFAQEPQTITLEQALALAEQHNPQLATVQAMAGAAAARVDLALTATKPRAFLSVSTTATDDPAVVFGQKLSAGALEGRDFELSRINSPDPRGHLSTRLGGEWPLDPFHKTEAAVGASRAGMDAASAGIGEARAELRRGVTEAYYRAAVAARAIAVTASALEGARAREREIAARTEQGAALTSDLLRARARRREREADLAARNADQQVALAALAHALGGERGERWMPSELPPEPKALAEPLEAWIERASKSRPALAAAAARREAARWGEVGEERSTKPNVLLWGQIQDERGHSFDGQVTGLIGASLRWGFVDPAVQARRALAAAESRTAAEAERAAAEAVRLEVETAYARAVATRDRWDATRGGAEEGREALRVVAARRQAGIATLTDELETEAASLAAELNELAAAMEAALADAALARAAGTL